MVTEKENVPIYVKVRSKHESQLREWKGEGQVQSC